MKQQLTLTGIVLSAGVVGEYDKRVVILTKERGKITAFARGARKPGNALMGITSPFTYGKFTCYKGYDAYYVTSAEIVDYFEDLKHDLDAVCYATYFCELADYFTLEGSTDKTMLNLLYVSFKALMRKQMEYPLIRCAFEVKLLEIEGLGMQVFHCVKCQKEDSYYLFDAASGGVLCEACKTNALNPVIMDESTLYTLQHIRSCDLTTLFNFQVTKMVLRQLEKICKSYLRVHVDKELKSLEMLDIL